MYVWYVYTVELSMIHYDVPIKVSIESDYNWLWFAHLIDCASIYVSSMIATACSGDWINSAIRMHATTYILFEKKHSVG